eukprot:gene9293-12551_t
MGLILFHLGIVNYRLRFQKLLFLGGIQKPKASILERLHKLKNTVFITAATPREAAYWYNWAKDIPQTATRDYFLGITGYQLDGMHAYFEGILLAGDDKGICYMLKQMRFDSKEAIFASRVTGKPFIVATSFENAEAIDANNIRHSCEGLLMRMFERALFGNIYQLSFAALLHRCKSMIIAINSIHTDGIVHMDLKESNIF